MNNNYYAICLGWVGNISIIFFVFSTTAFHSTVKHRINRQFVAMKFTGKPRLLRFVLAAACVGSAVYLVHYALPVMRPLIMSVENLQGGYQIPKFASAVSETMFAGEKTRTYPRGDMKFQSVDPKKMAFKDKLDEGLEPWCSKWGVVAGVSEAVHRQVGRTKIAQIIVSRAQVFKLTAIIAIRPLKTGFRRYFMLHRLWGNVNIPG